MIVQIVLTIDIQFTQFQMKKLENYIFTQIKNTPIFDIIQQQIDDVNTEYYDPKLFLFPMTYKNLDRLKQFNISQEFSRISALNRLNMFANPYYNYSSDIQKEATEIINILSSEKPDLQNFFKVQLDYLNQSINMYSEHFNLIEDNLDLKILKDCKLCADGEENIFQFIVNGTKSEQYDLHFTSPVPLQKLSKDVVFLINDFQDSHSVLKTLHESASVYDRIWFFQVTGETKHRNLIQLVYGRDYVSLQAALNAYKLISQYIEQKIENEYISSSLISLIIKQVIVTTKGANYIVKQIIDERIVPTTASYEIVFFVFGPYNIVSSKYHYQDKNINIFFISLPQADFQFVPPFKNVVSLVYTSQQDYINIQLPKIVKHLNQLFVSTGDEIGSVNDSVIIARALFDKNSEYIGMLLVKPNVFRTFSDVIMNNLDGLSGTTLKIRMMEQQRSILNPFYQFMPSISYIGGTPEPLIQTTPCQLNDYAQIQFNDVLSTTLIKVVKIHNSSINSYTESLYGLYQMQISRKEFSINVAISSTALTTRNRNRYSNIGCVIPQSMIFQAPQFNITKLRELTAVPFKRTSDDCLVIDNDKCVIKDIVEISSKVKQKVITEFIPQMTIYCAEKSKSSKFSLYLDSDKLLSNIQSYQDYLDVNTIVNDYQYLKNAMLQVDQTSINKFRIKYMNLVAINQKQFLDIDTCILVQQDNKYISTRQFSSLKGQVVVSPNLVYGLYLKSAEIMHFSRYLVQLESLLSNKFIKSIYLGHTWLADEDVSYSTIYDQQKSIENIMGTQESKIINRFCSDIARVYNTHYFMFSTNQSNNEIVQNEQLKSNIDGTNGKFRLSVVDQKTFLTKPLISRTKSILGTPNVQGYLTLELNSKNIFQQLQFFGTQFYIMDGSGSILNGYDNEIQQQIKQILIKHKYLVQKQMNSTIQQVHITCTKNNEFWDSAYKRSVDNEFTLIVNQNISRLIGILTEDDYNQSAVYQRTIIFDAKSDLFYGGQIILMEFSVLNEFLIILKDVTTQVQVKSNIYIEQQLIDQFQKSIPQNITVLDSLYGDLTQRSNRIAQNIDRFQLNQIESIVVSKNTNVYPIMIGCLSLILILIVIIVSCQQYKRQFQQVVDINYFSSLDLSCNLFNNLFDNLSFQTEQQTTSPEFNFNGIERLTWPNVNYVFQDDQKNYHNTVNFEHTDLLSQLHFQSNPENYVSFIVHCTQQQYCNFVILQTKLDSFLPNKLQLFKFNCKIRASMRSFCIPTQRMFTINQRNVSKLATRIQTQIQSRIYSKTVSQCQSRQELIDTIDDIPFWFDDYDIFYKREVQNPFGVTEFFVEKPFIEDQVVIANLLAEAVIQ
ncbi:Conserved_hypothetical protein [Hexamita inflata]|uniref:Transmembrane protein n=1 Tax=Hexamita inflata TaxID=28002 RepID=A0AA86QXC4_9EUKA|nr:Conserved hypothetical protein [Hexamita inflata]